MKESTRNLFIIFILVIGFVGGTSVAYTTVGRTPHNVRTSQDVHFHRERDIHYGHYNCNDGPIFR